MTCNHSWGSELKTGFLNGSPRHRRKPAVKYHSINNDILNFVPIVDHFPSTLILISSPSLLPTDRPYCCLNSEPLEPACCWFAMCHLCFYSENPDTLLPSSCSSHICGLLFSSLSSFLLLFFLRTLCLSFVFCWFFFFLINYYFPFSCSLCLQRLNEFTHICICLYLWRSVSQSAPWLYVCRWFLFSMFFWLWFGVGTIWFKCLYFVVFWFFFVFFCIIILVGNRNVSSYILPVLFEITAVVICCCCFFFWLLLAQKEPVWLLKWRPSCDLATRSFCRFKRVVIIF